MKKIALALVLLASIGAANADAIYNKNGLTVVVTNHKCVIEGKEYKKLSRAYAKIDGKNAVAEGCWMINEADQSKLSIAFASGFESWKLTEFKEIK
jgi:hypothetical protein